MARHQRHGADGLTKGSVSRHALHQLMAGAMHILHEWEQWRRKVGGSRKAEVHLCLLALTQVLDPEDRDLNLGSLDLSISQAGSKTPFAPDCPLAQSELMASSSQATMDVDISAAAIAVSTEAASMKIETAISSSDAEMQNFAEDLVRDKRGELWRKKKQHKELGGTHSLTEIHKYLKSFKPDSLAPRRAQQEMFHMEASRTSQRQCATAARQVEATFSGQPIP